MPTDQTIIDKLERADGPCREMDKEIAVSSGEYVTSRHHPGMLAHKDSPNQFGYFFPAYTASIDAAMTMVPEGWTVTMGWTPEMVSWAHLESTHEIWPGNASTPALALCIASLRARSQGGE